MIQRKPDLDPSIREDIAYYSTDQLARLYHEETSGLIRLRNANISREELKAEIQWRQWRESWRFWITLSVTVIGTIAAIIAAIEGWRTL